eukprot:8933204-Pyramimonas_sp.AAC.1
MGPQKVGTPTCAFVYFYLALGLSRHCAIAWHSTAWVPKKVGTPMCASSFMVICPGPIPPVFCIA